MHELPITGGGGGGGAWGGTPLVTTLIVGIGVFPLFVAFGVLELPNWVSIEKENTFIYILSYSTFYFI